MGLLLDFGAKMRNPSPSYRASTKLLVSGRLMKIKNKSNIMSQKELVRVTTKALSVPNVSPITHETIGLNAVRVLPWE